MEKEPAPRWAFVIVGILICLSIAPFLVPRVEAWPDNRYVGCYVMDWKRGVMCQGFIGSDVPEVMLNIAMIWQTLWLIPFSEILDRT